MTGPGAQGGGHARWIIVTPSPADEAWRSAIRAGAAEAGLTVLAHDPAIPGSVLQDPKVVIYAQDAATAVTAGAKTITAILPDVASAVAAFQATYQTPRGTSIRNASQLLAGAAALGLEHLVIGEDQLKSLDGPLRVFPDLTIVPPPPAPVVHEDEAARGIAEILGVYHGGRPVVGAPAIEWPLDSLYYDERVVRTATSVREIDLTGRPRILVYGPYVALPPGLWRAKIRFSVDDAAAAGRQLRIDWGAQTHYASETFTPGRPGVFDLELDYRWTAVEPAEVRFIVMEGCFSGTASFIGVQVSLIGAADDTPPPIADTPGA